MQHGFRGFNSKHQVSRVKTSTRSNHHIVPSTSFSRTTVTATIIKVRLQNKLKSTKFKGFLILIKFLVNGGVFQRAIKSATVTVSSLFHRVHCV